MTPENFPFESSEWTGNIGTSAQKFYLIILETILEVSLGSLVDQSSGDGGKGWTQPGLTNPRSALKRQWSLLVSGCFCLMFQPFVYYLLSFDFSRICQFVEILLEDIEWFFPSCLTFDCVTILLSFLSRFLAGFCFSGNNPLCVTCPSLIKHSFSQVNV